MVALTLTVYVLVKWVFAPMRSPGSDHVHLFARGPCQKNMLIITRHVTIEPGPSCTTTMESPQHILGGGVSG